MKSEKILASQRATIHRYVTYPRADLNLDGTIWAQAPGRPEHTRLGIIKIDCFRFIEKISSNSDKFRDSMMRCYDGKDCKQTTLWRERGQGEFVTSLILRITHWLFQECLRHCFNLIQSNCIRIIPS